MGEPRIKGNISRNRDVPRFDFAHASTGSWEVYAIPLNPAKPPITPSRVEAGSGTAERCVCVSDSLGKLRVPVAEHLPNEVVQLERQRPGVRIRQLRESVLEPTRRVPSNSVNWPRTVAMPMCLTAKPTFECAGSRTQVPVGTIVGLSVVVLIADLLCARGC